MEELLEIKELVLKLEEQMKAERRSYMQVISIMGDKVTLLEHILRENGIDFE